MAQLPQLAPRVDESQPARLEQTWETHSQRNHNGEAKGVETALLIRQKSSLETASGSHQAATDKSEPIQRTCLVQVRQIVAVMNFKRLAARHLDQQLREEAVTIVASRLTDGGKGEKSPESSAGDLATMCFMFQPKTASVTAQSTLQALARC